MAGTLSNGLRQRRLRAGLSQKDLAARAGLTRQALGAIEAARQVPSTVAALSLAAALDCRVEDVFELPGGPALRARLTSPGSGRVTLGRVGGRWVAHPLGRTMGAADGLAARGVKEARVEPLLPIARLEENVLVAGCAPVLALLAQRMDRRHGRLSWVPAGSYRALELLERGLVHAAGTHLVDEQRGVDNLTLLSEHFGERRMLVVHLTRWVQGLLLRAGNPLEIRNPAELARPGVRVAWREPGAGATRLLERRLSAAGVGPQQQPMGPMVSSHHQVAQAISLGAADAGIAVEGVALAHGLDFIPLTEERFDLVIPAAWATHPPVRRLLEALDDPGFRAELGHLAGYDGSTAGHVSYIEAA